MATTVPAMKARLGDTDYYIISMKAKEVTEKIKIPKETKNPEGKDWEELTIEERYQRDINYERVKKQIAPYLANDDSRFFGAIIVAAMNFGEKVSFEPLSSVTMKGVPNLYRTVADNMGFLTFDGGEVLVPLDGQHRLKAIEFAITGRDEKGKDISNITPCTQLAQEDVTVILVPYERKKARKIFTRVNRYAKPTTAGQNIVTDDDDFIAVLAREIANNMIGGRLAKFTHNTLSANDSEFTTLSTIYNCNKAIISTFPDGELDTTKLPDSGKQQLYRKKVHEVWEILREDIEVFSDALRDPEETGDESRREIRKASLLGKPVTQECLVRAFLRLVDTPTNLGQKEACEKLNNLPWSIDEENLQMWQNILWSGGMNGKIITKNRKLITEIISYLAGEKLDEQQTAELLEHYRNQFPEAERQEKQLPVIPS